MSLRARLLIASVVLVLAGLVVADVATYRFLSSFLVKRVDEQLVDAQEPAAEALAVQSQFGQHPGPRPRNLPGGTWAALLRPSGERVGEPAVFLYPGGQRPPGPVLPSNLPGSTGSAVPLGQASTFDATAEGGGFSYRVRAISLGPSQGTVVVAIPLTDVQDTLGRLITVEVIVSAVVLLAVAGLALWLVRLGLRPLVGMEATAGAIAAGDLTRRVEPADGRTEVGRLGVALNSMLAQIEEAFEERRASENRLRRFVADASHELRTPLTSIRGYAELFRRGAESRPEDLAIAMRRIEAEAVRMGIMVDDLLLLARLDQGRPLERDEVDLSAVVRESVDAARSIEPDRPIDLRTDGAARVVGDRDRLRQVVDNLLSNVRVHTPSGTPAEVFVGSDGPEVLLSVTDHGPGLDEAVARRAFERFYRGDPARSRETGGVGLGLSIVSAIVEAHGGSVAIANRDEGGARFEVRLPAHHQPAL